MNRMNGKEEKEALEKVVLRMRWGLMVAVCHREG